jgi:hypothetical protein
MKPSSTFAHPAKLALLMAVTLVCPVVLLAQNNKKTTTPPPPPPKAAAPATAQKPVNTVKPPVNTGKPQVNAGKPVANSAKAAVNTGKPPANTAKTPAPSPKPSTETHPGGTKTVTTTDGRKLDYGKGGHLDRVITNKGTEAHFDSRGKVSTIRTANGTTIVHGPGGQRQTVSEHRDARGRVDSRVVRMGPHREFVEHRFDRGGHGYMRRTYVYGGRTDVRVYREYAYRGGVYYRYVPAYYYHPGFYGWAYNPWVAPVSYRWGWYVSPWYGPYGYYFTPYPVYPSAAYWLTDYLVAENLQAAYEAQAAANASANGVTDQAYAQAQTPGQQPAQDNSVTLSPEVKQMIAEEVKAQLAAEQSAATQSGSSATAPASVPPQPAANTEEVPPALDPNHRIFVVATSLDVNAAGQPCSLNPGDIIMRTENTPDSSNAVGVNVVSSQKADCRSGSAPRVQVADLEEMHNHFREQMDAGLKTLADNQGKNGIPTGPAANPKAVPEGTAVPDLTATADLQKQRQDADQAEKEVQQASSSGSSAGGNN